MEGDHAGVVLVGVQLDPLRTTGMGSVEGQRRGARRSPAPRRLPRRTGPRPSGRIRSFSRQSRAEAPLADAARRRGVAINAAAGARWRARRSAARPRRRRRPSAARSRPSRVAGNADRRVTWAASCGCAGQASITAAAPARARRDHGAPFARRIDDRAARLTTNWNSRGASPEATRLGRDRRRLTVPALWAVISCSIFIASMIAVRRPARPVRRSRRRSSAPSPASGWRARPRHCQHQHGGRAERARAVSRTRPPGAGVHARAPLRQAVRAHLSVSPTSTV